jgi:predicted RNA-binding Zn ribbon-like protein
VEPLPVELMNTVRADRGGVHDTIADPAAAARWLRAARPEIEIGIAGWEAVAELLELRDALRCLAAAATGDDRQAARAAPAGDDRRADRIGSSRDDRQAGQDAPGGDGGKAVRGGEDGHVAVTAAELEAAVGVVNRACATAPSWSELQWTRDPAPAAPPEEPRPRRVARTAHAPALAAVAAIAEEAVALLAGPDRLLLRACRAPGCVLYFVRNHPRREWCSDGCGNRARVARHYQRHHASGSHGSESDVSGSHGSGREDD